MRSYTNKHARLFTIIASLLLIGVFTSIIFTSHKANACATVNSGGSTVTVTCDGNPSWKCRVLVNGSLYRECLGIANTTITDLRPE